MNISKHIENGVIFESFVDVIIDENVKIGKGTIIKSGNHLLGDTIIGQNCTIDVGNLIENSCIGDNVYIIKSVIKNSKIDSNSTVGPFSNIHTRSSIGKNCRVGNFVEIKNSTIGNETKMAHLAYIGDADIGSYCNIGCGAIFVNYDGKNKHRSTVGNSVFIGSNSNIIAPVNLCDNAYIAAGTTVTVDLPKDCLCIGRNRETIKENRSKYHKEYLKKYFGTDGIRGKYPDFITEKIAFYVGNFLGYSSNNGTIIVGRDNRSSGNALSRSLIQGIITSGANVIDLGITTTPSVAFSTKKLDANYGIVITASHNPKDYNGIKIFNFDGRKLTDIEEIEIEKFIDASTPYISNNIGNINNGEVCLSDYFSNLKEIGTSLSGCKIVLDCSNGASSSIAPKIFHELGGAIVTINTSNDGNIINDNCGALYPEKCKSVVSSVNADVGFAFDGDADRIIAIDEKCNVLDGDDILYIIAKYLKEQNLLFNNTIVCTHQTNCGIIESLNKIGIDTIKCDVGDHYVMQEMFKNNCILGGEQSGHIILKQLSNTGDGVMIALYLSKIMKETGLTLYQLNDAKKYPQISTSIEVSNKKALTDNVELTKYLSKLEKELGKNCRIIVRASGTEPKIRIMVECGSKNTAEITLNKIIDKVNELNKI